ncbi:glycosyltransferase [Pontibacter sp. H249]|uniref:glycosyltransferase n=1 Tax=Pontibacter sp. H249 TaxID=3133420 RepID=UPI0030BDD5E7
MKDNCILFTSSYPFGTSESFIEGEIMYLAEAFKKVYVLPMKSGGRKRELPGNVSVVDLFSNYSYSRKRSLVFGGKVFLETFSGLISKALSGRLALNDFSSLLSLYIRLNDKAALLADWLKSTSNCVLYSYWFEEWATILAILKSKKQINEFHARAHGFDLYEERSEYGFIPFRSLQLKEVSTLSAVSQAGYNYLSGLYPQYLQKLFLHRLGVQDNGISPFILKKDFVLVSCSNVISLKRVDLIVRILYEITQPLKWIHFGDGEQLNYIVKLAQDLPKNISVEFRGRITNQELIQFYKNNQVDIFITTTETEGGCPVSLQEAISFGIPVIGTNVGGVPEIVNNRTGILIDKDFDPKAVAISIDSFLISSFNSFKFRLEVRKFWEQSFVAEENYKSYINRVLLSKGIN